MSQFKFFALQVILKVVIYVLATLFGLLGCIGSFASECTAGNIRHIKHGRKPNARVSIFPVIPIVPLFFVGVAWILRLLAPAHAFSLFSVLALILSVLWLVSYLRLRAEFRQTIAELDSRLP